VHEIDVAAAAEQLKSLLEAALKGERVVITEDAGSVELVPVKPHRKRVFGSARGVFEIPESFDAPLADFDEYRA
jgi:antitoxin (DNA-binding transcriptional repressor) of toxin-antitoxin stability system